MSKLARRCLLKWKWLLQSGVGRYFSIQNIPYDDLVSYITVQHKGIWHNPWDFCYSLFIWLYSYQHKFAGSMSYFKNSACYKNWFMKGILLLISQNQFTSNVFKWEMFSVTNITSPSSTMPRDTLLAILRNGVWPVNACSVIIGPTYYEGGVPKFIVSIECLLMA